MTIRDIAIAIGYKVDDKSYKRAVSSVDEFAKKAAKGIKAVGALIASVIFGQLAKTVEQYNQINAQLAYATDYLGNQLQLQNDIAKAAAETRTSYASMAASVSKMVQDTNSWSLTTDEALDYSEKLSKVFRGAGLSRDQAGSLVNQFAASFQNGKLQNLPQMLEQAPELINYLAKTLNMSTDAVKALAQAGAISLKQFTQAVYENAADIEERFERIPLSFSDAAAYVKEEMGLWLTQLNEKFQLMEKGVKLIKSLMDFIMPVLEKVLDFSDKISTALAPVFEGIETVINTANGAFEDFGKWFEGDSSYGNTFAQGLRERGENSSTARSGIKSILQEMWNGIKTVLAKVGPLLTALGQIAGRLTTSVLTMIVNFLQQNAPLIDSILQFVADILDLLTALMPIIEVLISIVTYAAEFLTKLVNWILNSTIGTAIQKILEGFHRLLDWLGIVKDDSKETADATKAVATAVAGSANPSSVISGDKTVTILVNNDYTFNGADRSAQKAAVQYISEGAEDIYNDLKLGLNFVG